MPLINGVLVLIILGIVGWLANDYFAADGTIKTILNVVVGLIVVGMLLWLINTYVPMAGSIKAILNIVVVVGVCIRVLQAVGLWDDTVALWGKLRTHRNPS